MQFRLAIVLALSCAAIGVSVEAHHSHANYDNTKWRLLEGTVKQVHWVFPHSWIHIEVKNDQGQVESVALEASNPNQIREAGISREDVKVGDRIGPRCHPLRDAKATGCLLGFVTPLHGDAARGHGVEKPWN